MFNPGSTVPDKTRFRLRYIHSPEQRKKARGESVRKIGPSGVVCPGSAGLSQQNGDVVSPAQENLFLTRWLATALRQRRFSRDVASDIGGCLNRGVSWASMRSWPESLITCGIPVPASCLSKMICSG
jgi:hypothetical protein